MEKKILNMSRIHISKNNLKTALLDLSKYLEGKPKLNELIIISQNFHTFSEQKGKGILSFEQEELQRNRITNSLLELINKIEEEGNKDYNKNSTPLVDTTSLLGELLDTLETTYDAFLAQVKIRNLLVDNMIKRLKISKPLQYEVFFSTYFSEMKDEELRLHNTIRSYTKNVLGQYNQQAINLVQQNKELKQKIPRLRELERHLIIWLGKYNGVFQTTPSMSLVYVGVEEGIPFPNGIEDEIKLYLKEN